MRRRLGTGLKDLKKLVCIANKGVSRLAACKVSRPEIEQTSQMSRQFREEKAGLGFGAGLWRRCAAGAYIQCIHVVRHLLIAGVDS